MFQRLKFIFGSWNMNTSGEKCLVSIHRSCSVEKSLSYGIPFALIFHIRSVLSSFSMKLLPHGKFGMSFLIRFCRYFFFLYFALVLFCNEVGLVVLGVIVINDEMRFLARALVVTTMVSIIVGYWVVYVCSCFRRCLRRLHFWVLARWNYWMVVTFSARCCSCVVELRSSVGYSAFHCCCVLSLGDSWSDKDAVGEEVEPC